MQGIEMRRWIRVVEESAENPFGSLTLRSFILPARTSLYHGTDRPGWDPAKHDIYLPVWFSFDFSGAAKYARFRQSGEHGPMVVHEYVTTENLNLLEASDRQVSELMDELYSDFTSDDVAGMVIDLGFDGWHIKDEEIMLGVAAFRFVKTHMLEESSKYCHGRALLEATPSRLAPDVGTTFEYQGYRYRVTGWLKEREPPPEPKSFQDEIARIIYQTQQEVAPHRKKLVGCTRREAEYVSGAGVSGVIAPVEEIKVVGRVNWPEDVIDRHREMANSMVGEIVW